MKKAVSIMIASCLIMLTAKAQKSLTLSVNGGIAAPSDNFSKADYANDKSGYAKTGGTVNVTGVLHLNKSFGISALAGYTQFGHKGALNLAEGYKEDSGTDSTTLYTKGNNKSFSILAGPYYTIQAGKNFAVNLRVLGGYTSSSLAGFQVFYEDYTTNSMTQKKSTAGSFGLLAGIGVQYNITSKLFVAINADYFTSKPKFNIEYENFVVNSGRRLTTYNESISGINATAGIGIKLF